MPCSFAVGALVTTASLQACIGSLLSTSGGVMTGPLTLAATAQNTVRNGSLEIGNSNFFRSSFQTEGPQLATFSRVGSASTDRDGILSYYRVNHSGGDERVISNLHVATQVDSTPAEGIWGFLSSLSSRSGGGNGGTTGYLAGYWQTVRSGVPIPHTVIAAAPIGASTATSVRVADTADFFAGYARGVGYPVSPEHPLAVSIGSGRYAVTGVTPDETDATHGSGTLIVRPALAGTDARVGTPITGDVVGANLWGGVIEYKEQVDLPSSRTGVGQTLELDWVGNNVDDADKRTFISAVLGKYAKDGTDVQIGNVIGVWAGANMTATTGGSIGRGFWVGVPFREAIIDTRQAAQNDGANAIWLGDGHRIALDASGRRTLQEADGALRYHTEAGTAFSVSAAGQGRFAGPVAGEALIVGSEQVVGTRQRGWDPPQGPVSRERLATGWHTVASQTYRAAEMRAVIDQVGALSRTLGALITDLSRHGLIGP